MARTRYLCLLLVFGTVVAYSSVLKCDFVNLDDPDYVLGNNVVLRGPTLAGVGWALASTDVGMWHPVTWLSHMLDVRLYGLNPAGHHMTSLVFHAANVVLLFLVLRSMTGALWRSLAVAALFALHPLHVESVAWVAERRDVLGAFFGLLALWAYGGYARQPTGWRFGLVAAPFALALMSKAMLVTLPFVMLLLDHWPLRRPETPWRLVMEKLPLLLMSGAVAILAFLAAQRTVFEVGDLPLATRLTNALVACGWYVAKTMWPARLSVFYPLPAAWPAWEIAMAATVVGAMSALAVAARRSHPYIAVGWLWFVGMLLPVSGLVQLGSRAMADHFAYLPLIGLFVIVTWGVGELLSRWPIRPSVMAACAAMLVVALGLRTSAQVGYWQSSTRLFSHALAVTTDNWLAHNNLGDALVRQGRLDEAVVEFSEALRLLPSYPDAHYNLGVALMRRGQTDQAVEQYAAALRVNPSHASAHTNLGIALVDQGRTEEAIGHLTEALRLRPDAVTHFNLGLALAKQGSNGKAIVHYRDAVRLAPTFAEAHYQLAQALAARGRRTEADEHYATAIRLRPEWAHTSSGTTR
ncbi:MAG TPA: tetratricopeptide repeat protein [Candidatus Binatus sp.]|nr:tetratricopeptide repeat protein [Candidatus Binatus sp.]